MISGINSYNSVYVYSQNTPSSTSSEPPKATTSSIFGGDRVSLLLENSDKVANYISGGYNAYKHGAEVSSSLKNITSDFSGSLTATFKTSIAGAGVGAIVVGAARGWEEAVKMAQGRTTLGKATGGIIGSTIQGAVGGAGGVVAGGLSNLMAAGIGLGGTPLMIATVLGGAVGAALTSKLVNTSSIEGKISSAID